MDNHPLRFALIGSAGYIAPRHLQAIRDTGHQLVCALDRFDVMGVIDRYFPEADFFTEPERFDRHLDKLRRQPEKKIDYVSICSPNYMHDAHIRLALRNGAHAICEKPLVLNPWNLDALKDIEQENDRRIYSILQVRLHPQIVALKERIQKEIAHGKTWDVDLTYITSRGRWYFISWKGNTEKSGGVATNIGIHFFDMLIWLFGAVKESIVHLNEPSKAAGLLHLQNARVRWFLSLDYNDIPPAMKKLGQRTYRMITMGNDEIEFSDGFTDLHTRSYREIISGGGFGIEESKPAIEIAYQIRNATTQPLTGEFHPLLIG